MKRTFLILLLVLAWPFCLSAQPLRLTLMPQWVPQAQFAGLYVASEKGFFEQEGLEMQIVHIGAGSSMSPSECLDNDEVDIITGDALHMMVSVANGSQVVNILQTSQQSGLRIVDSRPIRDLEDLVGRKVARWNASFTETLDIIQFDSGLRVNWVPVHTGVMTYIYGAVDAILVMSYNEYNQILSFRGNIPQDNVFDFSRTKYAFPEDGVYVKRQFAKDHPDVVEKIVRSIRRGWEYAAAHREETLDIVMKQVTDSHVGTNRVNQGMMLDEVLRLQLDPVTGKRSFAPIDRKTYDVMIGMAVNAGLVKTNLKYETFLGYE